MQRSRVEERSDETSAVRRVRLSEMAMTVTIGRLARLPWFVYRVH